MTRERRVGAFDVWCLFSFLPRCPGGVLGHRHCLNPTMTRKNPLHVCRRICLALDSRCGDVRTGLFLVWLSRLQGGASKLMRYILTLYIRVIVDYERIKKRMPAMLLSLLTTQYKSRRLQSTAQCKVGGRRLQLNRRVLLDDGQTISAGSHAAAGGGFALCDPTYTYVATRT